MSVDGRVEHTVGLVPGPSARSRRRFTILHTIQSGGPGGAETVILKLASGLDRQRFHSIVLCADGSWLPARLREREIPCYLTASRRWYYPEVLLRMARLVRSENVDLIHSHLPGQNLYACLVGRLLRRPTVVNYHGAIELEESANWRGSAQLLAIRRMASVSVVVCDQMARALQGVGFLGDRIVRIYNGIDEARFRQEPAGVLRRELGLTRGEPLVGMVANVRPPKGHENFIRSARRIADRFPTAHFAAAGEDTNELGRRLRAMVAALGLEDRFHFLGFRPDVAHVLRDLDVFVLPSSSEGLPFVALEAMAAGKPSVMTRCGGPEEIVRDGVTGYLVPVGDEVSLADRVCELLADPTRASLFGLAAQERIRQHFSADQMIARYEELYTRLLQRSC
jgi:glycosyltransferase involved in cell wall biosynthesis